jgi:cytochrome c oxidase assembly protein subunit 15
MLASLKQPSFPRYGPRTYAGQLDLRMARALRWLAVLATVGMCIVLQQGTLVTNSGSAAGCANTWPLCNGQIIPAFRGVGGTARFIEFSHRAAVPVESTLIILLSASVLWCFRRRREVQVLAPAMIVFLFLQAMLGGLAVMYPTSAEILAAHFGISLLAFASIALTTSFLLELNGFEQVRDRPISWGLRSLIRAGMVWTYIVVYLGAYVRHMNASLACIDWPLCNGAVIPQFSTGVTEQFLHRMGAAILVLLLVTTLGMARHLRTTRPDIFWGSVAAVVLVVLQALSGAIVVEVRVTIWSTLLHAFLISILFCTQAYLWMHTIRLPRTAQGGAGMDTAARRVPVAAQ